MSKTKGNLDDALERNEAKMLAYVARTQGVEAAHKLSRKQLRDRTITLICGIAFVVVFVVWFTDLALWIKWLVTGLAVLPMAVAPFLARRNADQLDEERERQLREHLASKAGREESDPSAD